MQVFNRSERIFFLNCMYVIFIAPSLIFVYMPVALGVCFFQRTGKILQNDDLYGYVPGC